MQKHFFTLLILLLTLSVTVVSASVPRVDMPASAETIQVTNFRFDPLAEGEPTIPLNLRQIDSASGLRFVQFTGATQDAWLTALTSQGIDVLQYYPHHTYLVWASDAQLAAVEAQPFVRWTGNFHPAYKIHTDIQNRAGLIEYVSIVFYNDGNVAATLDAIGNLSADVRQVYPAQTDRTFFVARVALNAPLIETVALLPQVVWMGYAGTPAVEDEMATQTIAPDYDENFVPQVGYNPFLTDLGYDGTGVIVAIVDTGVDYAHPDIGNDGNGPDRIVGGENFLGCIASPLEPGDDAAAGGGHGSHVAGIVGGDATAGFTDSDGFLYGQGVAPGVSFFAMNPICIGATDTRTFAEHHQIAVQGGATLSNNSYTSGEGTAHGYQESERMFDAIVKDSDFDTPEVEPFIVVFSAGNSGPEDSTLTAPKEAKNVIVTAASQNHRAGHIGNIAGFSSRGPAVDGRVGVTITAPGERIASSANSTSGLCALPTDLIIEDSLGTYSYCSGTSMASPHIAGAVALATEWWRDTQGGADPSPAIARALLVNSAIDMSRTDPIPNKDEGWGRANISEMIAPSVPTIYRDQLDIFTETGQSNTFEIAVVDPSKPLKVTVAWSDALGAVGANPALVNDLDLTVVNGGNTYLGNAFEDGMSALGGSADSLETLENVFIANPAADATITIAATNIAGDGVYGNEDMTDQDYALICYNCSLTPTFALEVTPSVAAACQPDSVSYDLSLSSILGFSGAVDLSVTGVPAGASATFDDTTLALPGSTTLTIGNTAAAAGGSYQLEIIGDSDGVQQITPVTFNLSAGLAAVPAAITPVNGSIDSGASPLLTWGDVSADSYTVQLASDPAFTNILASATGLTGTSFAPDVTLADGTAYYWRVQPSNGCGTSDFSEIFSFVTGAAGDPVCTTPTLGIFPDNPLPGISNSMQYDVEGTITDLNVSLDVTHPWIADVVVTLDRDGTEIMLTNGVGACDGDDIDVVLDDAAAVPIDSAAACVADAVPAASGVFQPVGSLATFNGATTNATYTINISDKELLPTDVQTLNEWCLIFGAPVSADFSDLAASFGVAMHTGDGTLKIGDNWDVDANSAEGQDNDTDDGITPGATWAQDQPFTLDVVTTGTGANGSWLTVWIDWNNDGDFADAGEQVASQSAEARATINGTVPATASVDANGVAYRVRLFDSAEEPVGVSADGSSDGGEVTDGRTPQIEGNVPTAVGLQQVSAESNVLWLVLTAALSVLLISALVWRRKS